MLFMGKTRFWIIALIQFFKGLIYVLSYHITKIKQVFQNAIANVYDFLIFEHKATGLFTLKSRSLTFP